MSLLRAQPAGQRLLTPVSQMSDSPVDILRAISYTFRNLKSHLSISRSVLPPDLDQNIPAFQLSENGFLERHPDKYAYESINAAGKIVLQATPAYQFEPIVENRNRNTTHTNASSVISLEAKRRSTQDEDHFDSFSDSSRSDDGSDNDMKWMKRASLPLSLIYFQKHSNVTRA
eukprot:g9393.t1